jgi:hypothetical protein
VVLPFAAHERGREPPKLRVQRFRESRAGIPAAFAGVDEDLRDSHPIVAVWHATAGYCGNVTGLNSRDVQPRWCCLSVSSVVGAPDLEA